jgi:Ca2+-binding EF-hand superfamily protein
MKVQILGLSALALGAGGLSGPAFGQAGAQVTAEQAIAFVDKDRDGKCSLEEFLEFQAVRMVQLDADGDGALSLNEFRNSLQGAARQNAKKSFDAFNRESVLNALSQREFLGYHAYVFKTFVDTDKDGFMSAAEWSALMAQVQPQG